MNERQSRVASKFFNVYYGSSRQTWNNTFWFGHQLMKCPMDLWVYQELIYAVKPDLLIETGTYRGGSAYYFASLFDLLQQGEVVTIDIDELPDRPVHPRITYLTGSSTADDMVAHVRARSLGKHTVMVVLDADHTEAHVRRELDLYSPLVTPGSYLVVEDTCVNGHPVLPDFGPGPMEAVEHFLATSVDFEADKNMERHLVSFNPGGWLRRGTPETRRARMAG